MAYNIAKVGVDKKSGAPIIQRSSNFIYNNDPNGTRDIFYYFGSRLNSSSWINPNTTNFITASRLNGGSITGPATTAVDNNASTNLFQNSTDETDGFQVQFNIAPFKLLEIQLNTNDPNWTIQGSNNGTNWTDINYPGFGNLGDDWFLLSVTNNTFYSYYRILHNEPGFTKTFGTVKFFGEYQNGDIAPGIEEEATFLATHKNGPGIIYLPDAAAESFPENYYCTIVHFKSGEYTYQAFSGGGTSINDNTNGVLKQGEQLLAVYDNGNWELFKVGSGVDLTSKGTLITSDGIETTFLSVGPNGSFLVADSSQPNGLKYQTLNLSSIDAPITTVNFSNQRITGVGTPTSPTDAVTKNYADSIAAGLDPKASCDVATTGPLNSSTGLTWTAAGSGANKTLTSNGVSATIDNILLQNGLRVLVKDQVNAVDNGIYLVSNVGTAVTLTRTSDFNNSTNVTPGAFTFITNGAINGATGYILLGNGTLIVDTNNLNFSQFAGAGAVTLVSLPDTNLTPLNTTSTGRFIGWNDASGFFELYEKAGTEVGDLVKLIDNSGNPAYPSLDGTLINLDATQVSPLINKGDVWIHNGTNNTRLPAGPDNNIAFTNNSTATGFEYREPTSNDLNITYTPTEFQVNFNTGINTVELGPIHVDNNLSPNDNEFLRYDAATSRFVAEDPTGTNIDDLVILEDVASNPGLPAVDGSQLTNLTVNPGQGSTLTTKGDLYVYSNTNSRLPVGTNGFALVADSTSQYGLSYKDVRNISRIVKEITNETAPTPRLFTNNTANNDVISYVGELEGTQTWTNPFTANLVDINLKNIGILNSAGKSTNSNLVDRSILTGPNSPWSSASNDGYIEIDFKKINYVNPTQVSYYNANSILTYNALGSNDGTNFTALGSLTVTNGNDKWGNIICSGTAFYRYIRLTTTGNIFNAFALELQVYGYISPSTSLYTIKAEDEKALLYNSQNQDTTVILPAGLNEGFYFFIQNKTLQNTIFANDGSSTILNNKILRNIGDYAFITNVGNDTWIVSSIDIALPTVKGQISTYSTKPNLLNAGSNGQVLTVNNASTNGIRWENRADASDLIYAKEIPTSILSATVTDIFKTLNTVSYTYPASNGIITLTTNTTSGVNNPLALVSNSFADTFELNASQYVQFQFLTSTIQPYSLSIYDTQNNASTLTLDIQVSNNGTTWTTVGANTFNIGETGVWYSVNLDTNGYYSYLRLVNTGSSLLNLNELKLFGWLKSNPQVGEIFAVSNSGITPIKSSNDNYILVADSTQSTGVKWSPAPEFSFTVDTIVSLGTVSYAGLPASNSTYPDIIYRFGTQDGTQAWTNPTTAGYIQTYVKSSYGANADTVNAGATDLLTNSSVISYISSFTGGSGKQIVKVDFLQSNAVTPTYMLLRLDSAFGAGGTETVRLIEFEGSNDNSTWTKLGEINYRPGGGGLVGWSVGWHAYQNTLAPNTSYRYLALRYYSNDSNPGGAATSSGSEVLIYGDYIPTQPFGTLDSSNLGNLLLLPNTTNNYSLNIPDNSGSFSPGWYCYVKTVGSKNANIQSNNLAVINTASDLTLSRAEEFGILINPLGNNNWSFINLTYRLPSLAETTEVTATGTITLTVLSNNIQVINPNGANRTLILPDPPVKDLYFKIINSNAVNFSIDIKETAAGSVVKTLDVTTPYVECHRTNTQWVIIS